MDIGPKERDRDAATSDCTMPHRGGPGRLPPHEATEIDGDEAVQRCDPALSGDRFRVPSYRNGAKGCALDRNDDEGFGWAGSMHEDAVSPVYPGRRPRSCCIFTIRRPGVIWTRRRSRFTLTRRRSRLHLDEKKIPFHLHGTKAPFSLYGGKDVRLHSFSSSSLHQGYIPSHHATALDAIASFISPFEQ